MSCTPASHLFSRAKTARSRSSRRITACAPGRALVRLTCPALFGHAMHYDMQMQSQTPVLTYSWPPLPQEGQGWPQTA